MRKVIEDKEYGYLRLDPIPSKEEVNEFYAKEFYISNDKYFNNSSLDVQQKINLIFLKKDGKKFTPFVKKVPK